MTSYQLRSFLSCFILLVGLQLHAQETLPTSSFGGPTGGSSILPEDIRVNVPGQNNATNIQFYRLVYRTPTLDLRILDKYTKYDVPESIVIIPPDLSMFDHTMVLVGLYGNEKDPDIVIWLAGNYNRNNITIFLDYDQDRDFNNDLTNPIRMKRGDAPRPVSLRTQRGVEQFMLGVPKQKIAVKRERARINKRPVIGFQAGAGTGELTYSYQSTDLHEYYVNISEKNVGATISYYGLHYIVGTSFMLQNGYYYASYSSLNGNRTTQVNQDLHPPNKLQMGLYAAYRFQIGKHIEIQPLVRYGVTNYLNKQYKSSRYADSGYDLKGNNFFEYGVKLEFGVGRTSVFFIELAKNNQDWKPEGLPGTDLDSFDSEMFISKFNVGYSFPFGF